MSDTLIRPRPSIGPTIGPGFVASGTAAQPAPALRPHRARVAPTPTPACEESTTAGISYAEPPRSRRPGRSWPWWRSSLSRF